MDLLQQDATIPIARIADHVGLSQTPCWKRIQKHEEAGTIKARVALLDPDAFGLGLTAFVMVEAMAHTPEARTELVSVLSTLDAVRDVYRLAGNYDFLLRIVVPDTAAFDALYVELTTRVRLRSVNSLFALERVAVSSALPLSTLSIERS